MKVINNILVVVMLSIGALFCGCGDSPTPEPTPTPTPTPDPEDPKIEVTYENLDAIWMLKGIDDALIDGDNSYFYIDIDGKTQEYIIYENLNSSFSHKKIGSFVIGDDEIITGSYDNMPQVEWTDSYLIKFLTKNSMTWTGTNSKQVQAFVLVSEVPQEIVNGSRSVAN